MKLLKTCLCIVIVLALTILVDMVTLFSISNLNTDLSLVDTNVFPHHKVINVSITIAEEDYQKMLDTPLNEEYFKANVDYNGYTFNSVAIRTKGNSSLKSVANTNSDRYSLKLDLDYYISEQNLFGIKNINLNNLFADNTMMAEYLAYEMLSELETAVPRTTYTALYINDKYVGLYLSVEQVDESFLLNNYGNANGELYKPYQGEGCNLEYTTDNGKSYSGLQIKNKVNSANNKLVELLKAIESPEKLDNIFNVDSFLKYLAMSVATIHLDCYQGGMFHNYYIYNNNDSFEWIAWDLNMAFNGFPKGPNEPEAFDFYIDEPVIGNMSNYPLIEAIFSKDEYVDKYHNYLQQIASGYFNYTTFNDRVLEIYNMIKGYVKADPTAFYSYDEFEEALFADSENHVSLLNFAKLSSTNIKQQLAGDKQSTNNGNGNVSGTNNRNINKNKPPNNGEQKEKPTGTKNDKNMPFKFNENGQVILPKDVSLNDLPSSLQQYLIKGELPPRQEFENILEQFSPELKQKLGLNKQIGFEGERQVQDKQPKQSSFYGLIPNLILLILGTLGLIVFTLFIKHKF
ncbi:CotH kinase family protein [Clostridium sp. 'deep sea']|uniref:CotH kinase family protein n=1 Tax=Clostridium sp. 'deep sea' TaxID=2779445 RepID=UPI00189653F5|nr:CotH kinase family protein [Clostridium sp. 'deep sea']QOR36575.1 CotH kinase family protein [Clostridium sp. 'deep sea']